MNLCLHYARRVSVTRLKHFSQKVVAIVCHAVVHLKVTR